MRRQLFTVLGTEFIDHSRDRRSLFAALMYALFGPVLVLAMLTMIAKQVGNDRPVSLAVHGAAHAPTLVAELERRDIKVERREGAAAEIPALAGADAVLVIPPDYPDRYRAGEPAELTLFRDERRDSSTLAARKVAAQIESYGSDIAHARLIARGVPAETMRPIQVIGANVAAAGAATLQIATMLLYFFVAAPFFSSMTVAIDSTAGERERKSLHPLLSQPVDPSVLILGKWANAALFGMAGTAIAVVLGMNLLHFAPLEELRVSIPLDAGTQIRMILVVLPLALAASALQIMLALLAKSFKEAQTYLTLLSFAPVVLAFSGSFGGREPEGFMEVAPVLGQIELLRALVADGELDLGKVAVASVLCLLLAAAALWQATRQLKDEKILGAG
ncbi:ABC transporter permease [Indioceanicola profundi]|uniref:ABC transporter permease n=1 Tax=Indioceanicola profundi TaxID=2220096 RepID=UPI000E6ABD19|nr:ABC transporter permease subunit [Indioceanicola profundi]